MVADATSYNVYQATASGGPYTQVANVATTNHTVTSLTNGTTYFFVIRAANGGGEGPASVELSGAPNTVPGAPATLTATPGDTQVSLSWSAVGGITGYRVERAAVSGGPYTPVTTVGSGTTTYDNTGLTNGTTYYYVVRGVNGSVVGPASPEDSATPTPPPPPTFNRARGADGQVAGISPATDVSGDIYITGDLNSFGNTAINEVARINSNGTVDAAFNTGTGFGNGYGICVAAAVDGSGDVYVGGSFASYNGTAGINNVVRLNSDGSRDAVFNTGTGFDFAVFAVAPALDGSGAVYVGGQFSTYNGSARSCIVRLSSDGAIDPGFAIGIGFSGVVNVIAPLASGEVYVGGAFTSYNGTAAFRLVRISSDGTIDSGFDTTTGADDQVEAIALATDGSGDVYVAGRFTGWKGTPARYILRLDSDGTLDSAFATGITFGNSVHALAVPSGVSGDVYAGGTFTAIGATAINRIVRLNPNGSIDAAFDVGVGANSTVEALTLATDGTGDVFMGGAFTSYKGTGIDRVARVNTDGSVDAGLPSGSGFNAEVRAAALPNDASGDVYAAGVFTNYNGTTANNIVRLNSDGAIDAGFNTGLGFSGSTVFALALAADASGDVYAGGTFTSYHINPVQNMVRINSNGAIDTVFDTASGFNGTVRAIAPVPTGVNVATDGDVYVGGSFTTYKGSPAARIVRLNSDGTVDAGFVPGTGFNADVNTLLVDAAGDIYVGGNFTDYNVMAVTRIVRLNSDGTVDAGFDTGTGTNFSVSAIALAADASGDVFAGGNFDTYRGAAAGKLVRINSDGTVDAGFSALLVGEVTSLLPLADGSGDLYAGGRLQFYSVTPVRHLVRLNSNGTHDTGFLASGQGFRFADTYVYALSFLPDGSGRLYAGGNVTGFRGTTMDYLGRITASAGLE